MCFLLEVFKFYVISARSWSNLTLIICLGFVLFISPHWARHCRGIAVVATVRWGIVCGNNHLNQLNPHLDPANCPSQGPGFGGWTPDVVYGWGLSPMGSHTPWIPMNSIGKHHGKPGPNTLADPPEIRFNSHQFASQLGKVETHNHAMTCKAGWFTLLFWPA